MECARLDHGVANDELVAVSETEKASFARADAGYHSDSSIHSADSVVTEEPGEGRLLIHGILVLPAITWHVRC